MSILKRGIAVALCAGAVLAAAGVVNAGQKYAHSDKRVYDRQDRSYVVVEEGSEVRTPFDYFFNNPDKYKHMRNGPGEYYEGLTR